MKVKISRSYSDIGNFELDKMSDEVLGAVVRAMVDKADERDDYKIVSLEVVKEEEAA